MKIIAVICLGVVAGLLSFVTVQAQDIPKEIKGGILNGKASYLPSPDYPAEAKDAGIEGTVVVDVLIDGSGTVISAVARPEVVKTRSSKEVDEEESAVVDPLFHQAAEKAARDARFPPTLLNGVPVNVSGSVVYSFMPDAAGAPVNGGILNGKANSLPKPTYPEVSTSLRVSGSVVVQVVIDENGDVISATAVSGHPFLRAKAVQAARAAKFAPTKLSGQPVKVAGTLTYNFVPPKKEETTN